LNTDGKYPRVVIENQSSVES